MEKEGEIFSLAVREGGFPLLFMGIAAESGISSKSMRGTVIFFSSL